MTLKSEFNNCRKELFLTMRDERAFYLGAAAFFRVLMQVKDIYQAPAPIAHEVQRLELEMANYFGSAILTKDYAKQNNGH